MKIVSENQFSGKTHFYTIASRCEVCQFRADHYGGYARHVSRAHEMTMAEYGIRFGSSAMKWHSCAMCRQEAFYILNYDLQSLESMEGQILTILPLYRVSHPIMQRGFSEKF